MLCPHGGDMEELPFRGACSGAAGRAGPAVAAAVQRDRGCFPGGERNTGSRNKHPCGGLQHGWGSVFSCSS